MAFPHPFQMIFVWHPANERVAGIIENLRRRYQSDDIDDQGYSGVNTGFLRLDIDISRCSPVFDVVKKPPPDLQLDCAECVLVVAFIDENISSNKECIQWLDKQYQAIKKEQKKKRPIQLIPVIMEESHRNQYENHGGTIFKTLQSLEFTKAPERALREEFLAMRILYTACKLLSNDEKPRIFISHAKSDGVPLARGFLSLLKELPWKLDYFYDDQDLLPGEDFAKVLESAAQASCVMALRTRVYDSREWCRKEVQWAIEEQMPILVVEASDHQNMNMGKRFLTNTPVVWIGDGNLFRALDYALRETLRCLILRRLVTALENKSSQNRSKSRYTHYGKGEVFLLVRPPEIPDLIRARDYFDDLHLDEQTQKIIIYPGPALAPEEQDQYVDIAKSLCDAQLISIDQLYGRIPS